MQHYRIDLVSDTTTRPTAAMRRAMAEAIVGDEQKHEDPTTNRLAAMVAELTGKEAAVFLPSGAMCNQIAIRVHCRPGDEIMVHRTAHIFNYEGAGHAALSGATAMPLEGPRGMFTADAVQAAVRPQSNHHSRSRLLCVEQTTNMGGGAVWPLDQVREVCAAARAHGMATHLDGARLLNAVVATGIPAHTWCEPFDSVWIDFSKGLGAPVGAVLAGDRAFIREAWRAKHQFGGAMRQSGIIAAAAIHALEHHIERLAEDHDNARRLGGLLEAIPGVRVESPIETNMVFFDVAEAGLTGAELIRRIAADGVRVSPGGRPTRLRAVTHLDVTGTMIDDAAAAIAKAVGAGKGSDL
ncbi:MAG: threonine aldolase family protein [Candidatus Sumerlaeia bacterium]|nr:threonine aldolase family protein [Candidatus Sumerlaeia bacterium]